MKQVASGETAQLEKLATGIAGAINEMMDADAKKQRLGIRMATISFSFHRDKNG